MLGFTIGEISRQTGMSEKATNGFIRKEPLVRLLPFIHAMNIDLKSFRPE